MEIAPRVIGSERDRSRNVQPTLATEINNAHIALVVPTAATAARKAQLNADGWFRPLSSLGLIAATHSSPHFDVTLRPRDLVIDALSAHLVHAVAGLIAEYLARFDFASLHIGLRVQHAEPAEAVFVHFRWRDYMVSALHVDRLLVELLPFHALQSGVIDREHPRLVLPVDSPTLLPCDASWQQQRDRLLELEADPTSEAAIFFHSQCGFLVQLVFMHSVLCLQLRTTGCNSARQSQNTLLVRAAPRVGVAAAAAARGNDRSVHRCCAER